MEGKKGQYELGIRISGETDKSLAASIAKAKGQLNHLEKSAGLSSEAIRETFGWSDVRGIDKLASLSDKAFAGVKLAAGAAAAGITMIGGASIAAGASFEEQMSTVQAISQASDSEMGLLTDLAEKMGRETRFSATEAGQGLEFMAMAGWKTQDMMNGLPGIMDLAAASGESLGSVSDIVTDSMTAFGLEAKDSAMFADVLAQAASSSNTNVAMMGATFQYAAPVAGSFGYTIQDVAAATGLMANAGIKGEKAGTALRGMFTNLAKPTKEVSRYMKKMGISLTDTYGKMKPFSQLMTEMREGFSGLTQKAQKAEYAAGIAGKEGMSGLLAIVNASDDDFTELTEAIENSAGAAERMAAIRLDNLNGDLTLLKSAAEGAGIGIYKGLSGPLRGITQLATGWINSLTNNIEAELPTIRRELISFGTEVGKGFGPLLDVGKWFLKNPQVIKGSLAGIAAALTTFKAAKVAKDATRILSGLSAVIGAWPVAAAGLAAGAIVGIGVAIKEADKKAVEQNLADHFGDIRLSLEELNEAARGTLGNGLFDSIDELASVSGKSSELYQSMQSSLKELNRNNWKISMGIEFNADDETAYMAAVDSYVKSAQEYITNKGYELKLAVDIVMGDTPDKEQALQDSGAFYSSLDSQVAGITQKLHDELAQAVEDGLEFPDKQAIVQKYLNEVAEITQMITEAENASKLQMIQTRFSGADMMDADTFQNYEQALSEYAEMASASIDSSQEKILTDLNARRIAGEKGMEGGISQEEFKQLSTEANQSYYASKAQVFKESYQAMRDTIMQTYGSEIQPALDMVNQQIEQALAQAPEGADSDELSVYVHQAYMSAAAALQDMDIGEDAKGAINKLLEGMTPTVGQINALAEQYKASGGRMTDAAMSGIREMIGDNSSLEAVTGSFEGMMKYIGTMVGNDKHFAEMSGYGNAIGKEPSKGFVEGIESQRDVVDHAVDEFYGHVGNAIQTSFGAGFDVAAPIRLKLLPDSVSMPPMPSIPALDKSRLENPGKTKTPGKRAKGGIVTSPELSWIAEAGYSEAVIPLDGSSNAMTLWEEVGRLLGVYEKNNYGRMHESMASFDTSPVRDRGSDNSSEPLSAILHIEQNFYGNTDKNTVESANESAYETFCEYLERYFHHERRVSF